MTYLAWRNRTSRTYTTPCVSRVSTQCFSADDDDDDLGQKPHDLSTSGRRLHLAIGPVLPANLLISMGERSGGVFNSMGGWSNIGIYFRCTLDEILIMGAFAQDLNTTSPCSLDRFRVKIFIQIWDVCPNLLPLGFKSCQNPYGKCQSSHQAHY